jgi:uncharacterized protein
VNSREGASIRTFTGRTFWPLDPRAEDVEIADIAHALSNLCRYTGHTRRFYSVAQHSVLVAELVEPAHRPWGLLHDAAEAYLGDMAGTVKLADAPLGAGYREAEARVTRAIAERFGLEWPEPPEVEAADRALLVAEFRDLMPLHDGDLEWLTERYGAAPHDEIVPWPPEHAEAAFLDTYSSLRRAGVT